MEQHWSTVCALMLALSALVHYDIVFAAEPNVIETAKPGVCPGRHWGFGLCAEFCYKDSNCPGDEKCCPNGCGHACMLPYTVKPGRCDIPIRTGMCAEYCYHDGQCPEAQKCCKTSCGHACSEPCSGQSTVI